MVEYSFDCRAWGSSCYVEGTECYHCKHDERNSEGHIVKTTYGLRTTFELVGSAGDQDCWRYICHIRQGHLMPFWWWCAQTHCQKHYPTWNVVFNVDVDSWGWSRGLTSCKTDRNHSMLNAWIQNMCLNCFNSHNSRLWSSPLSLLHFCSCFEKNISRPHVECTRVTN